MKWRFAPPSRRRTRVSSALITNSSAAAAARHRPGRGTSFWISNFALRACLRNTLSDSPPKPDSDQTDGEKRHRTGFRYRREYSDQLAGIVDSVDVRCTWNGARHIDGCEHSILIGETMHGVVLTGSARNDVGARNHTGIVDRDGEDFTRARIADGRELPPAIQEAVTRTARLSHISPDNVASIINAVDTRFQGAGDVDRRKHTVHIDEAVACGVYKTAHDLTIIINCVSGRMVRGAGSPEARKGSVLVQEAVRNAQIIQCPDDLAGVIYSRGARGIKRYRGVKHSENTIAVQKAMVRYA